MFTVRDVLDRLPRTALVPLGRERGLAIRGRVEGLRAGLTKLYARRVADLLRDLRYIDLTKLFRRSFAVDGVTYRLRNRSRFAKAELLDIALTLFARGEIHEAFSTEVVMDIDDEDETDEEADGDEESDPVEADGDDVPPQVQAMLDTLRGDRWSTPRSLPRLLNLLYGHAFTRLRTARFQRLLEDLHGYRVEVALESDPDDDALPLDAKSPGLDVPVRLRLRDGEGEAEGDGDGADLDGELLEEEASADDLPTAIRNALAALDGGAWSTSHPLARLLSQVYGREFTRLRTERFHRLVSDLDARGVELCFGDDPEERPLSLDAESPGLDARVRLRRVTKRVIVVPNPPRGTGRPSASPPAAASAPALPIRVVPDPVTRAPPGPPTKVAPYELALLRLEFLTATPCAGRAHDPMWPNAFLDAATRGIDLDDRSLRFLRLAANTFVSGSHDPMVRVTRLTRTLHADEWPLLLLDFERLNPDADPDAVASVVRYASELASLPVEPVTAVVLPTAPPSLSPRTRPVPAAARAPSPRPQSAQERGGERDLGPLKNMFDE